MTRSRPALALPLKAWETSPIGLREPAIDDFNRFIKRLANVTLSLMFLVLLSPALLVIAILIKLDSAGPIFYRQQRVGENGKLFRMYKFRTVVPDADQQLDEVVQTTSEGVSVFGNRKQTSSTR